MPGCQSYALIARSRGPLLLSLSQQIMNWEWKSVGKQGKDVKAPPWAWKKTSHRILLYDNHIGRVETHVLHTKLQITLKYRKKWSFLPNDKSPGHFCNEKEGEREKRESWEGEGRESLREPGLSLQPTAEGHWSLLRSWRQLPTWLSKALEETKEAKGFFSPWPPKCFPPAGLAQCLLHALNPSVSTAQWKICCVSVSLQSILKLVLLPFSLGRGTENWTPHSFLYRAWIWDY